MWRDGLYESTSLQSNDLHAFEEFVRFWTGDVDHELTETFLETTLGGHLFFLCFFPSFEKRESLQLPKKYSLYSIVFFVFLFDFGKKNFIDKTGFCIIVVLKW